MEGMERREGRDRGRKEKRRGKLSKERRKGRWHQILGGGKKKAGNREGGKDEAWKRKIKG